LPLPVSVQGRVSAGAFAWFQYRTLSVSVVVKSCYALGPDGKLTPTPAPAPQSADRHYRDDPSAAVREPSDHVPYRDHVDVLFAGRAYSQGQVRLALSRERVMIVDRIVMPGADGSGLGPIAASAPDREMLLRGQRPPSGDQAVMMLSDDFDRRYFQRAPVEQRAAELKPGDQLFLQGLHPVAERLIVTLPTDVPRATATLGAQSSDVFLRCDQLLVDTERGVCVFSWRGGVTLPDQRYLAQLQLLASGLEAVTPETMALGEGDFSVMAAAPAFAALTPNPSRGARADQGGGNSFAKALRKKLQRGAPQVAPPPPSVRTPDPGPISGTAFLDPASAALSPTPFAAPVAEQELEGTVGLDGVVASAAMPFEAGLPRTAPRAAGEIPGAPWAMSSAAAPVPMAHDAVDATMALSSGPSGFELFSSASDRSAIEEQERKERERAAAAEAEERRRAAEAEAEARRQAAAAAFAVEQELLRRKEEERQEAARKAKAEAAQKLKAGIFGGFRKK
jgi:hypothetical protein